MNLGRHVEHDERSRDYPARSATSNRPVLWKRHGKVFDQGELGSCTGNALAGALNTEPLHKAHAKILHEKDAVKLYELASTLDEVEGSYPPDDTGSSGLAVCKAAKELGLIAAYRHAFGITHALGALQVGPVITGVDWYEGFDSPGEHGLVEIAGQVRGGHEFEVIGYDPSRRLVRAVNSWGPDWGERGCFSLTVDAWATLLEARGDVTVPVLGSLADGSQREARATVNLSGLKRGEVATVDLDDPYIARLVSGGILVLDD